MHRCDVMILFVENKGYGIKRTCWLALLLTRVSYGRTEHENYEPCPESKDISRVGR